MVSCLATDPRLHVGDEPVSSERQFTGEQLEAGVANAIAARDFQAAIDILTAMVGIDPDRAVRVYDEIQLGMSLNKLANPGPTA